MKLAIYPNPSSHFITLNNDLNIRDVQIFDSTGKSLMQRKSLDNNQIDISRPNTGIYLLKVNTDKGSGIARFVKN